MPSKSVKKMNLGLVFMAGRVEGDMVAARIWWMEIVKKPIRAVSL